MPEVTVTRTDTKTKARYVATVAGVEGEGELTLSKVSDTLIIADHTSVPESMRGLGVAGVLVTRLISDARAEGQRIVPLCPFVRAQAMRRGSDWDDVIQW